MLAKGQITITAVDPISSLTEPANKFEGMIWIDISLANPIQKVYRNGVWEPVNDVTEKLDDVRAAYQKAIDIQAQYTKLLLESYIDKKITGEEASRIEELRKMYEDAQNYALELAGKTSTGVPNLLREWDPEMFNLKYWTGPTIGNEIDAETFDPVEGFTLGEGNYDFVDERGLLIEVRF